MFIGYIYKITGACGGVYIGSTVNYKNRTSSHKYIFNDTSSKYLEKPLVFGIIRQDKYKLVKTMLLVEQYYIDNAINCVNQVRAYLGVKMKKQREKESKKKYRETHKIEIKERDLNYRKNHLKQIHLTQKKWYENNKERLIKKQNDYRLTHLEEIKKKKSIKIECKYCKTFIRNSDMARHKKTKRCQAIQKSLNLS